MTTSATAEKESNQEPTPAGRLRTAGFILKELFRHPHDNFAFDRSTLAVLRRTGDAIEITLSDDRVMKGTYIAEGESWVRMRDEVGVRKIYRKNVKDVKRI